MRYSRIVYYCEVALALVREIVWFWPIRFKKSGLQYFVGSLHHLFALKEVVLDDDYEKNGVRVLSSDKVIVDVGGGIGDFSIMIGKRFPRSVVYVFEPNHSDFRLLQKNIEINKLRNVQAICESVVSLRQVFEHTRTKYIDFLKIDCEGAEHSIVQGLLLKRVKKISGEYHLFEKQSLRMLRKNIETHGHIFHDYSNRNVPLIGFFTSFLS